MSTSSVFSQSPDYPIKQFRLAFSNWYTQSQGQESPEKAGETELLVEASILVDGEVIGRITFDGKSQVAIRPGQNSWSDPFPVPNWQRKHFEVRTFSKVQEGSAKVTSYRVKSSGDSGGLGVHYSSSIETHQSLLAGAPLNNNGYSSFRHYFGPSAMVTDGWDGRDVVLIVGDSIGFGDYFGRSFVTQGLSLMPTRTPFINLSVQGTRPSDQSSKERGAFAFKSGLIDDVTDMNGGTPGFTQILSQHGANDAHAKDGQRLFGKLKVFWKFLNNQWPEIPITQTTLTPKTKKNSRWYQSRLSQQSSFSPPGSDRWQLEDRLHPLPKELHSIINLREAWTGSKNGWRWRELSCNAKLQGPVSRGEQALQVSSPLPEGAKLVIAPGTDSAEATYGDVINITSTPTSYLVELSSPLKSDHEKGTDVFCTMSRDGTHPTGSYALSFGAEVINQWRHQYLKLNSNTQDVL
ncbi:hypothetical protein ACFSJ3_12185 [Corallincola platygyrae]|uniref:Uncharacterized protein n=2 Tax=Corallincola platygyrae TaxID=1193278 RepID=A0ABW4XN91_9GAMM